jgi:hypothetical protein
MNGAALASCAAMTSSLVHWELMVRDVEQTKRFYGAVFGWTFSAAGPEYTMIDTGAPPGGGVLARPPGVVTSALNTYFAVEHVDATLRRVVEAGGHVIVPRMEIPNVGWFAMFADPEGIPVGIFQSKAGA